MCNQSFQSYSHMYNDELQTALIRRFAQNDAEIHYFIVQWKLMRLEAGYAKRDDVRNRQ